MVHTHRVPERLAASIGDHWPPSPPRTVTLCVRSRCPPHSPPLALGRVGPQGCQPLSILQVRLLRHGIAGTQPPLRISLLPIENCVIHCQETIHVTAGNDRRAKFIEDCLRAISVTLSQIVKKI